MDIHDPKRMRDLLLHYGGPDDDEIFDTLTVPAMDIQQPMSEYDNAEKALTDYFTPKPNTAFEVYNFRQAVQQEGESMDSFTTRLRRLANSCGFADVETEIANQIIFACKSQALRRRALRDNMQLKDLIDAARSLDISERQASAVEQGSHDRATANFVHDGGKNGQNDKYRPKHRGQSCNRYKRSKSRRRPQRDDTDSKTSHSQNSGICNYCGGNLPHACCPARGKRCGGCGKFGHFEKVCRSAERNTANNVVAEISSQSQTDEFDYVFTVNPCHDLVLSAAHSFYNKLPTCSVVINRHSIQMTIDSGASVNIVDSDTYCLLKSCCKLQPVKTPVFPYGSENPLPVIGTITVCLQHGNNRVPSSLPYML